MGAWDLRGGVGGVAEAGQENSGGWPGGRPGTEWETSGGQP